MSEQMNLIAPSWDRGDISRRWIDFCDFSRKQIRSKDIDPVYPVLRAAFEAEELPPDERLWRLALYLTYYDLGSAEQAWLRWPLPTFQAAESLEALPTGVERRGMRGNQTAVRRFVTDLLNYANPHGGLAAWATLWADAGGRRGWRATRDEIERVWGVGTWASYKWADLLKNVMGFRIEADDIGVGGGSKSSGPVPGLILLTGHSWTDCATDKLLQEHVYQSAIRDRVPFLGLDELETCLCDYNSLYQGRYYVGADIDAMQTALPGGSELWESRKAIPPEYLGEKNGWTGVDKKRKTIYKMTGKIVDRLGE